MRAEGKSGMVEFFNLMIGNAGLVDLVWMVDQVMRAASLAAG